MNIFRLPVSTTELFSDDVPKDLFIFCLDSALEIHGYTTVVSTHIKILSNFNSDNYSSGINFVDRNRFPEYTKEDIVNHNGFLVTSKLRTLLDLFVEGFDDLALEFIDELREEYSAEEIIDYFKGKGEYDLLMEKLNFIEYNIYTMEGSYYDHV